MARMLTERKIVLASHNAGKLREISDLLGPYGLEVVSAGDLGLPEPEETETTFAGNARIKAHAAAGASGLPALSDDSGLMVDALDGAPGVYTADWAQTETGRDFAMAMGKVKQELDKEGAMEPWTAAFNCTLCVAWPDGEDRIFESRVAGTLTWPPRGDYGFGFDPMFIPTGHERTFSEMPYEEKAPISHRAVAFDLLVSECLTR
ncbi:MAG: RdgB/HAM1 family non-canonical purine NTP pyrophosphatase [Pseudomonadota bacterium]